MRMRKKPNLPARMERCAALLTERPEDCPGRWRELYRPGAPLHLELGCGKGRFTVEQSGAHPEALFVAMDVVPDAMVVAMERALEAGRDNLRFISGDAARLCDWFAPGEVDVLYINFCDPWPRNRHAKRRLTADGFLALYRVILKEGGCIRFKTDNRPLFDFSLERLAACGWRVTDVTYDLHADGPADIMTDYEVKFSEQGIPIHRCIAWKETKEV